MRHKKTRLYQRSLELVALARQVVEALPVGLGFLADQLRRSSASVLLNYSEGCGKRSARDRQRFFRIARGSVLEVDAILDVAHQWDAIDHEIHHHGKDLCDHISAMLYLFR